MVNRFKVDDSDIKVIVISLSIREDKDPIVVHAGVCSHKGLPVAE